MLDYQGNVAEATGANIFLKNKSESFTHLILRLFLDGITRRCVIDIAKSKGIKVNKEKWPEEMKILLDVF